MPDRRRRPTRAAQHPIAREAKDIILKWMAGGLRGPFPAALGLGLPPIVEVLPTDLPVLEVRAEQPDLLFRLADGSILHIEFQMTLLEGDLRRFYRYHFAISEQYGCKVYTVVLYGPGIAHADDTHDRGSAVYRVHNIYIGQREGELVVARLRERVGRDERLTDEERLDLELLPLMRHDRPLLEVLHEVAGLARALPREERDETIGVMVGLAYNYLTPDLASQLLEVLQMANALEKLVGETLVRGREEGRAEMVRTLDETLVRGREEGRAEMVRTLDETLVRGREEGRAEGELEGLRTAAKRLIERRFGQVSTPLAARLATADKAALERILDRLPAASNTDDLLDALR